MRRFFSLFFVLFLLLASGVFASDVSLEITEKGSVLDYYGIYYVVDVSGNVTVTNENDFPIYTIEVPMIPGTLSFSEPSSTSYMTEKGVKISHLGPFESTTFSYNLNGITTRDVIQYYSSHGVSVFAHLLQDERAHFRSDMWINLEKSDIGTVRGVPTRFIEVSVTNPTPLEYDIENIQVLRTDDHDVNNPNRIWTFEDKIRIVGGDRWSREFEDSGEGMREDSVYWFVIDHDLANTLVDLFEDVSLDIYDESYLDEVPKDDEDLEPPSEREKDIFATTKLFLRKVVEPTRVSPGDVINVSIITTNLDVVPRTVKISDTVPDGFEFYSMDKSSNESFINQDEDGNMFWEVIINRDTSRVIEYSLKFVDESAVGLQYFPVAEAVFEEGSVSSSRTPVIRQFIPNVKLYLQKNVRRLPKDMIEVTISIKNLGEAPLDKIVIKEHLLEENLFSEITQTPLEKGLWEIPSLARDQEWVVTYKTDSGADSGRLPQIFGVDQAYVLKTLIMDSVVSHYIFSPSISTIELVGIIMLILFPIFVILMYKKKILEKKTI